MLSALSILTFVTAALAVPAPLEVRGVPVAPPTGNLSPTWTFAGSGCPQGSNPTFVNSGNSQ
jgi:hypothetical protein